MSARRPFHRSQRGAALLTAMIIVTLVATMAATMVWQQWRAVRVEAAERARMQSAWILAGALDWARLILSEDGRGNLRVDHLGEPWAVPLAEARLSTFLAADKDNTDDAPDAFLSGSIVDAQSRYNLINLFDPATGKVNEEEVRGLQKLCAAAGLSSDVAGRLAAALAAARRGTDTAALMPESVSQLGWLGLDADTIQRLAPYVVLLPIATPVNLNTASREAIAASIVGIEIGDADQLVQWRQRKPFTSLEEARAKLPEAIELNEQRVSVNSSFFEVRGTLRLEDRVLQERALMRREGNNVVEVQRERVNLNDPGS